MAVISVTVTESSDQIVAGIPRTVSISTNISSTIFYTLDGTDPTILSTIYTGPLKLPTDKLTLILKIYATNGTDSSAIISNTYQASVLNNRVGHSGTDAQPNDSLTSLSAFPFASSPVQPNQNFTGVAEAGVTVYDPAELEFYSDGYDADGIASRFSNTEFIGIPTKDLQVTLSVADEIGQQRAAIGTIPKSTIQSPSVPALESSASDKLFDPKAFVIFQDFTKGDLPDDRAFVNRQYFTLENVEQTRQGNQFYNVGPDAPTVTGSFLRSHFNPNENTITYYYFDSVVNRWIISKTPYKPAPDMYNYAGIAFSNKSEGSRFVFEWKPFTRRYLL